MPEYVGNYSIATAYGNVEGAETLAGAGMLNFLNVYIQQTTLNAPPYSVGNSWFWCPVSSVVHEQSLSTCQFAGLTCTGRCYWYPDLSHPERDQLQKCLDNALVELEN
jgi:hypothetical protein